MKIDKIKEEQLKSLPDIQPGDTVRVHQKIKEAKKERIQVFEGIVLARKHGKGISATITVRRIVANVGVEKIFPIHSPSIEKIEISKKAKVRKAKLYYLREAKGKKARLKRKDFAEVIAEEEPKKEVVPEEPIENKEEPKKEVVPEETNPQAESKKEK